MYFKGMKCRKLASQRLDVLDAPQKLTGRSVQSPLCRGVYSLVWAYPGVFRPFKGTESSDLIFVRKSVLRYLKKIEKIQGNAGRDN